MIGQGEKPVNSFVMVDCARRPPEVK